MVDALRHEVTSARTAAAAADAEVAELLHSLNFVEKRKRLELDGLRLLSRARHLKERQIHDVRRELAMERREHSLLTLVQESTRADVAVATQTAGPPAVPVLDRLARALRTVVYAAAVGACLGFAYGGAGDVPTTCFAGA